MNFYEGRTIENTTICRDSYNGRWYAVVNFEPITEPAYRNVLHSKLEIRLKDPRLTKAIPRIIKELERRKVSTTHLRIKPYETDKKAA